MQDEYETIVPDVDVTAPQLTAEFVSINNVFVCSVHHTVKVLSHHRVTL